MVVIDAVVGIADWEQEDFDSLDVDVYFFRGLAGFHGIAFPKFAAIAGNAKHDAPLVGFGFIVHAHESGELFGAAF